MEDKKELDIYKRHIKDDKNNKRIEDFWKTDPQLGLIYKKTERLTTALYMITDFFNDREALKWELRSKVVSFLSFIASWRGGYAPSGVEHMHSRVVRILSEVLSLLELAVRIKLISPMNFSILREEYFSLGELIQLYTGERDPVNDFSFPENFFSQTALDGEGNKRQYKEHFNSNGHYSQDKRQQRDITSLEKAREQEQADDPRHLSAALSKMEKRNIRKRTIIRLLKTRGESTIKDISSVISNCSEKTLQRELMSLIAQGVVKKIGERRWSTYTLVTGNP